MRSFSATNVCLLRYYTNRETAESYSPCSRKTKSKVTSNSKVRADRIKIWTKSGQAEKIGLSKDTMKFIVNKVQKATRDYNFSIDIACNMYKITIMSRHRPKNIAIS